jgi:pullulanase/glycogen debranching enzyme
VASASTSPGDNVASSMRSIILTDAYDWEGDASPNRPLSETVIYELHVRGFTRSPAHRRRAWNTRGPLPGSSRSCLTSPGLA